MLIIAGSFICATSLVMYFGGRRRTPQAEARLAKHQTGVAVEKTMVGLSVGSVVGATQRGGAWKKMLSQLAAVAGQGWSRQSLAATEKKLIRAGGLASLSAAEYTAMRVALSTGIPSLFSIMSRGRSSVFFLTIAALIGWLLPQIMLDKKIAARQKQIRKAMPDMVDLLTVSVEAGLGFDAALQRVTEKAGGPLRDEFQHYLRSVRMGEQRRTALQAISERSGLPELHTFSVAIIQADQLGVSIGKVLRVQSDEIRRRRRQKAEEMAMKAPIKMLFPLILFIFPSIFIVLLGPAAINIAGFFMTLKIGR